MSLVVKEPLETDCIVSIALNAPVSNSKPAEADSTVRELTYSKPAQSATLTQSLAPAKPETDTKIVSFGHFSRLPAGTATQQCSDPQRSNISTRCPQMSAATSKVYVLDQSFHCAEMRIVIGLPEQDSSRSTSPQRQEDFVFDLSQVVFTSTNLTGPVGIRKLDFGTAVHGIDPKLYPNTDSKDCEERIPKDATAYELTLAYSGKLCADKIMHGMPPQTWCPALRQILHDLLPRPCTIRVLIISNDEIVNQVGRFNAEMAVEKTTGNVGYHNFFNRDPVTGQLMLDSFAGNGRWPVRALLPRNIYIDQAELLARVFGA